MTCFNSKKMMTTAKRNPYPVPVLQSGAGNDGNKSQYAASINFVNKAANHADGHAANMEALKAIPTTITKHYPSMENFELALTCNWKTGKNRKGGRRWFSFCRNHLIAFLVSLHHLMNEVNDFKEIHKLEIYAVSLRECEDCKTNRISTPKS